MSEHTPGPWKLFKKLTPGQFCSDYIIKAEEKYPICEVSLMHDGNAALISAAPELLEVAELILKEWEQPTEGVLPGELIARLSQYSDLARSAIAKAKGGER